MKLRYSPSVCHPFLLVRLIVQKILLGDKASLAVAEAIGEVRSE